MIATFHRFLISLVLLQTGTATAGEKIVTLGDSLTFAYEAEFGFRFTIPFGDSYGDGFGPEVKNWIEILNSPSYRKDHFDIGVRDHIWISIPILGGVNLLFRHQYNWSIPGLRIHELRRFVSGDATFLDLVNESDNSGQLALLFALSDFDPQNDFSLADMEEQIRSSATRLTLFIGGNDARGVYRNIYENNSPGTFVENFVADAEFILDRVLQLNPDIEIVLVNVPHVGITPGVQSRWPTDPVKTGRVTEVMRDLNGRLAALAASRDIGLADIFTPTLLLLEPRPFAIHGIEFTNTGSQTGNLNHVWLNGPISANFHPNTNVQAMVANVIIDAFNRRYDTGIRPLSATEILSGLLDKSPAQIDMPFPAWMAAHGLEGLPESDDSDGDGIPAGVEFALGLHPRLHDSEKVSTSLTPAGLELRYPLRLPSSFHYTLVPAFSENLSSPFTPFSNLPATGPDGLARAVLPLSGARGFLRLESALAP